MRFPVNQFGSKLPNWNLRIKESSSNGKWRQVISQYQDMQKAEQHLTDPSVFPLLLKACSNISFKLGKTMHGCLIKQGFESFTSIANSNIDFYIKWDDLDSSEIAFNCLENKDSISWNIIVYGSLCHGSLEGFWWFNKARFSGFRPNISTLVHIIQAFRDLKLFHEGLELHGYIIRSGFESIASVQNSMLNFYIDMDMRNAWKLFDGMSDRDIISWSVMIRGYVQSEEALIGLKMFKNMLSRFDMKPDGVILVTILKACAFLGEVIVGKLFHGLVITGGFDCDLFVGNSLIDMYSKCRDVELALTIFKEMPQRNIVSWNSLLSAYVFNKNHLKALNLLYSMEKEEGIEKDEVTLVNILQTCKDLMHGLNCKSVHCVVIRQGYESNEIVVNSLIDAYAKCNLIKIACPLFYGMSKMDVVSWSTMISGFTYCGMPNKAINAFKLMNMEEVKPNKVSIINLLEACAVHSELKMSKWAHGIATKTGLATDVAVGTAIINMYSKCGEIESSKQAFDQITEKNVVSWSAMIAACGMNGLGKEALALVEKMKENGVNPNDITALSLLSACSHGGFVEEGLSFFESMVLGHGLEPSLKHYSCIVDMLGRAGKVDKALELIENMPKGIKVGASAWGAFLSSCKNYGNRLLGEEAIARVLELEPLNSTGYMVASNLYATSGLLCEAARMRRLAKDRGVKVVAGYSLVHVNNEIGRFIAGDSSHPLADDINFMAEQLHSFMKMEYRNAYGFLEC